jgi:hypothetical protein
MKGTAGIWCRCALLLSCWVSLEGTAEGTFSSLIENDTIAGTDRHYTNGLEFSYLSDQDAVAESLRDGLAVMPGFGRKDVPRYGITFGQQIFTPKDTDATAPLPNERPSTTIAGATSGSAR